MSAGQMCSRVVATATPNEAVRTAARRMAEHDVGTLVVVDGARGTPAGMLTDRDLTLRCLAGNLDPDTTRVEELMSRPVQQIDEHAPMSEAIARMKVAAVRRLVVVGDAGRVVGILSLDDVLHLVSRDMCAIGALVDKQGSHALATV